MSDAVLALLNPALNELLAGEDDWPKFIQVGKWLKGARRFRQLALFSERLIRKDPPPEAVEIWHFHGQALVELGLLTAAETLLNNIEPMIGKIAPQYDRVAVDLLALRGRLAKQRFFDLVSDARRHRKDLLVDAAKHYRAAASRAGDKPELRYFPTINLVALAKIAEHRNWSLDIGGDSKKIATLVVADLEAVKASERATNPWWNATMAECHLALDEPKSFCEAITELVGAKKTDAEVTAENEKRKNALPFVETAPDVSEYRADAFVLASVTRQLNDIWNVKQHADAAVQELALGLDQALLKREGGSVAITPAAVKASDKLEAVFGENGPLPYRWIRNGMDAAKSVAAVVMQERGAWKRIGSSFRVAVSGAEGAFVLTNAHVISDDEAVQNGFPVATRASDIRLRFEALDDSNNYEVERIVWRSKIEAYDATLLLLKSAPADAKPLRPTRKVPNLDHARVYVIGYPKGDELCLSMQDNELLDDQRLKHPPPDETQPLLIHYRAPTEPGNSGSPVFDDNNWNVIALHHKSREQSGAGLTLSGRRRYPRANEGISMDSIAWAMKKKCGIDFDFAE